MFVCLSDLLTQFCLLPLSQSQSPGPGPKGAAASSDNRAPPPPSPSFLLPRSSPSSKFQGSSSSILWALDRSVKFLLSL